MWSNWRHFDVTITSFGRHSDIFEITMTSFRRRVIWRHNGGILPSQWRHFDDIISPSQWRHFAVTMTSFRRHNDVISTSPGLTRKPSGVFGRRESMRSWVTTVVLLLRPLTNQRTSPHSTGWAYKNTAPLHYCDTVQIQNQIVQKRQGA